MRKRTSDGSDLHVDLLDDSTGPLQLGVNASEFRSRLFGVRPDEQPRKGPSQTLLVTIPGRTAFHSGPKFIEYRNANADTMPQSARRFGPRSHTPSIILKILGNAGIEKIA